MKKTNDPPTFVADVNAIATIIFPVSNSMKETYLDFDYRNLKTVDINEKLIWKNGRSVVNSKLSVEHPYGHLKMSNSLGARNMS